VLRQGRDMAWVDEGDQVVVLHLPTGTYRGLPGTARLVWLLLLETGSVEETIATLQTGFEVPVEVLEADVRATVEQWLRDEWVEDDGEEPA